jgi:hypothetical protein
VQPVIAQDDGTGPIAGLFINSFNINGDPSGNDCFSTACHGITIWALAKPGTSSTTLTGLYNNNTLNYITPPLANEPGCTGCIETLDTRISGTPVYHNGRIWAALDTGVFNGTQTVPGFYDNQVQVYLNSNGSLNATVIVLRGYVNYSGDRAATFPAVMTDEEGNLFIVFESMSSTVNPQSLYASRRVASAVFTGANVLFAGAAPTFDSRWGDYEAASFDNFTTDNVWIAGEHSGAGGDWATGIGRVKFQITQP